MRSARARCADPEDGGHVVLCRDASTAPLVDLRRRLRAVLDAVEAIERSVLPCIGVVQSVVKISADWAAVSSYSGFCGFREQWAFSGLVRGQGKCMMVSMESSLMLLSMGGMRQFGSGSPFLLEDLLVRPHHGVHWI